MSSESWMARFAAATAPQRFAVVPVSCRHRRSGGGAAGGDYACPRSFAPCHKLHASGVGQRFHSLANYHNAPVTSTRRRRSTVTARVAGPQRRESFALASARGEVSAARPTIALAVARMMTLCTATPINEQQLARHRPLVNGDDHSLGHAIRAHGRRSMSSLIVRTLSARP